MPNDKNKSQFSLEPTEGYPNVFTINPHNPQQVLIKGSTMTFENGNTYNLNDPDELVDQIKLLYFEKVGGNDNPMLSEQIIAIVDKLLEYGCITTNQHQNLISTFIKKDQFVD